MFENLGNRLKISRINCNLSRKQISELTGVSVGMIGFYETGERLPSLPIIVKLASHYKVSVDYLLGINIEQKDILSLEGLTDEQIKALKLTAQCFRTPKTP